MSLKNNKWNTETLADEHYHINLEDNLTYDTQYIRYRLTTPHLPDKINERNMGTHQTSTIHMDHYSNFKPQNYHTERISIKGTPVVLSYNINEYNDKSPFVLNVMGSESTKEELRYDQAKVSLMDRGIVCAYALPPLLNSNTLMMSGLLTSPTNDTFDLIEISTFLKEKKIAPSLGVYAEGMSGSIIAL